MNAMAKELADSLTTIIDNKVRAAILVERERLAKVLENAEAKYGYMNGTFDFYATMTRLAADLRKGEG